MFPSYATIFRRHILNNIGVIYDMATKLLSLRANFSLRGNLTFLPLANTFPYVPEPFELSKFFYDR